MRHTAIYRSKQHATRSRTSMNIDRRKLARVREVLSTRTDTEAVDRALDLVIGNAEISAVIDEVFGTLPDFEVT